jgi:trigger factor
VKSTVEPLEGNKVKLVVELDEAEFEKDLDAAFSRLAKEVNLPGFRKGRAPRKVLEARIGSEYARGEAFREALPTYYSEAVREHEVDVIAPPDIDIVAGEDDGPVTFDAVVEVRPSIEVDGYQDLQVEIPAIEVTETDVDESVDRMRRQFSELETVDRPATAGDQVVIDIAAVHGGEQVPGMTTDGYNYEVGSGATGIDEFDENLEGASAGDELEFEADHPDEDEDDPIQFSIRVNEVQESVLPEATDAWVAENSEFDTLEELREDYRKRMSEGRLTRARQARVTKVSEAIAALVDDEQVPEAMVDGAVESHLQDMVMRLQQQGIGLEQYMAITGMDQGALLAQAREQADTSAKLDLALRAIAAQESIELDDSALDDELAEASAQVGRTVEELRADLVEAGQLQSIQADMLKSKTLDWLIERAELVDEDGQTISPDALELEDLEDEDDGDDAADATSEDPSEEE